jgi:histone-lysine N-methyltransferase SETMAR
MLEVQRDRVWHDIATLEDSWFNLSTDYEFVWRARDEKFPKENDTSFNQKIHAYDRLESARVPFDQGPEKGHKFNAGYYFTATLEPLSQWRSIEAAGNERKLLVHANNACPHTAKLSTQYFNENRMKSGPHPPYSPDLAPSDFYPFGYVKRCLV